MRRSLVVALACVMLTSGCIEFGSEDDGISFNGLEYNPPASAPDFDLTDHNGQNVTLSDFDGKILVVAFTYTSCYDVCPLIEANMNWVKNELGDDYGSKVEFVSITIDPIRDTQEVLSEYVTTNGYDWPHLSSTDHQMLMDMWNDWGIAVNTSMIEEHVLANQRAGLNGGHSVFYRSHTNYTQEYELDGSELDLGATGWNLTNQTFSANNVSFEFDSHYQMHNISGFAVAENGEWHWDLHVWNRSLNSWQATNLSVDEVDVEEFPHLAWVANNSDTASLPVPAATSECSGHGWIMGSGDDAHCMCDEGWEHAEGDSLSCVPQGQGSGTSGHEESDSQNGGQAEEIYQVGHTTVTYILDAQGNKRVAYVGSDWSTAEFLEDVETLADIN